MPITVKTAELPLHKFKFVMKTSSSSTSPQALHIIATKFETAVATAREEAKKHQADLAFSGVEAK